MKIMKEEYAIIPVCIEAELRVEGQGLELLKVLKNIGADEKFIKDIIMEASNEGFKIKNVQVLGE